MEVAFKQETQTSSICSRLPHACQIIMYLFFLHINSAIAMGIVQYLQLMLFASNLTLSTVAQKAVTCLNFKFAIDEDVVYNHILEGHVFQRLTVPDVI